MDIEIIAERGLRLRRAGTGPLPDDTSPADGNDSTPTTFIVLDGDDPVGVVEPRSAGPGAEAIRFRTAPTARRRGVATAAVRAYTQWAHAKGTHRIEFITDIEDIPAQRIAMSAGFTREGVRRGSGHRPAVTSADAGAERYDEVAWARLATDPPGPAQRRLPDLPDGGLTDGVVTLRPWGPDDIDDVFELANLPDVTATSVPPGPRSRALIAQYCIQAASEWLAGDRAGFTIRDAVSEAFAGQLGLYPEHQLGESMVGYSILPAWRGRGMATRAVRLVSRWSFDIGFTRVIAGVAPYNTGSQRVLEKAGFVHEATFRSRLPGPDGTLIDDLLYTLLPD